MTVIGGDGRWLRVNDACCEMLGYTRGAAGAWIRPKAAARLHADSPETVKAVEIDVTDIYAVRPHELLISEQHDPQTGEIPW